MSRSSPVVAVLLAQAVSLRAQADSIEALARSLDGEAPGAAAGDELLTVVAAAGLAGVTERVILRRIRGGMLAGTKPPGSRAWLVRRGDVMALYSPALKAAPASTARPLSAGDRARTAIAGAGYATPGKRRTA